MTLDFCCCCYIYSVFLNLYFIRDQKLNIQKVGPIVVFEVYIKSVDNYMLL